jgi:hypothetical protein
MPFDSGLHRRIGLAVGPGIDVLLGATDAFLFYRGTSSGVDPTPTTVSINGIELPLDDTTEYRSMSESTIRDGVATSSDQSEQLFNADGAWSRYRYSWLHGMGQEFGDLREDADPFRFELSYGINPWNDYELTLHHTMTMSKEHATGAMAFLIESGPYLFYASGTQLWRTDLTEISYDRWVSINLVGGGQIQGLATDGTDLYVAHTNGLSKVLGPARDSVGFTKPITANTHQVYFVGNRLLIGQSNVLSEVARDGTLLTVKDHFQPAFRWTTVFNIGSRIYIGGFAGIRSELYSVATDSVGALLQSVESAPLPFGELLYDGYAYAGAVLLLTSKGARLAQIGGDGTLTYGPLIEIDGAFAATADGPYAWVTDAANACLVRLDLSTFVEPLLPAHARDVQIGNGAPTAVAYFGRKLIVAVPNRGCFRQSLTRYEKVGFIDSGIITFGTVEQKVLTDIKVEYEPLEVGESVRVEVFDDLGNSIGTAVNAIVGSEGFTYDLDAEQVRHCQVRITLNGPGGTTPILKQWRMRAYPVVPPVQQWIVPLMLNSRVRINSGPGQVRDVDVAKVYDALVGLWRSKTAVNFRMGSRVERVRVDAYEMRGKKWNDAGSFIEGTLVLRLVKA